MILFLVWRRPSIVGRQVKEAGMVHAKEINACPIEGLDQVRKSLFKMGRRAVKHWVWSKIEITTELRMGTGGHFARI